MPAIRLPGKMSCAAIALSAALSSQSSQSFQAVRLKPQAVRLEPQAVRLKPDPTYYAMAPQSALPSVVPRFAREPNPVALRGAARPQRYMEASGLRAAFLGREDGSFEAWVYPLKVLHGFHLAFGTHTIRSPPPTRCGSFRATSRADWCCSTLVLEPCRSAGLQSCRGPRWSS